VATGNKTMVTHVGTIKVLYKDGTEMPIILKDVKVVPGMVKNLFSLSTVMCIDWDISMETQGKNKVMKMKKGNKAFVFDRKVLRNNNGGYLMENRKQKHRENQCCCIKRNKNRH